jgi:hypothetical protein
MASGDEGLLTISIGMRVSPEPRAIELLRRYNVALNYAINKILRLNLRSFRRIHNVLYRKLMEWFGLPSRIAIESYRDALANAKAWIRNPKRGGDQGLRSCACYCTKDRDIGLKMDMWRS